MSTKKSRATVTETTRAAKARTHLTAAVEALALGEPITAKLKAELVPLANFPAETISLVAAVVDEHGELIGGNFDSKAARSALAFEIEGRLIAAQARAFADRIDEQIIVRRAAVSEAALGVYQGMKGLVRLPQGKTMLPQLRRIAATLKTRGHKTQSRSAAAAPVAPVVPPASPGNAPA